MLLQTLANGLDALPLAAALLAIGGLALIASSSRIRNEGLLRRVAMVEPYVRRALKEAPALEDYLVRLPLTGLSAAEQREVVRGMARLGLRRGRALLAFIVARAG